MTGPKRLAAGLFLLAAAAFLACGAALLLVRSPYKGYAGEAAVVEFPSGTTTKSILATLEREGVVRNRHLAYAALRLLHRGRSVKAGEYRFEGPRSTEEVLRDLVEGGS